MKYQQNEIKPVEKIVLNEKNVKFRLLLFIICIVIMIGCFISVFVLKTKDKDGWNEIYASPNVAVNCDSDFVFWYNLGQADNTITYERKMISEAYTKALEKTYILLDSYNLYDGYNNVAYINSNINTIITVDPILYDSLKYMTQNNSYLFMAPLNYYYNNLMTSYNDYDASSFDPNKNSNTRKIFDDVASYVNNDGISIEFYEEYQIKLNVSEEYSKLITELEIANYIDFGIFKNAFILEEIVESLKENNFNNGYISTYDGYFVNMCQNNNYKISVLELDDSLPREIATITINEPISLVQFKNYMYYQKDANRYYKYEDNSYAHLYISPNDGNYTSCVNTLTGFSLNRSLIDIAFDMYKIYTAEAIDYSLLLEADTTYIWSENKTLYYSNDNFDNIVYWGTNEGKYKGELYK